jgi:hypothetical protein
MSLRYIAVSVIALSVLAAQSFASPAGSWMHHGKRHVAHTAWGHWAYFGSSYAMVPGRGIINEACNLPSSTCPNSQRANY